MLARALRVLYAPCAVLLLLSTTAFAQGIVDQSNDPNPTTRFGCGTPPILNGALMQSFTPAADSLIGVEVRLRAGDSFPDAGITATLRIRADDTDRTVLGEATAAISGPLSNQDDTLVRFDFDRIDLTPGDSYFIEWKTPNFNILGWAGNNDETYTAGRLYSCSGNPWPNAASDCNFVTYAAEPEVVPTTLSPCERIEALQARVGGLDLHPRAKKKLQRKLQLACKLLKRDNAQAAAMMLKVFCFKVRLMMHFRILSHDDGRALLENAREVRAQIQPRVPHRRSRRGCRG